MDHVNIYNMLDKMTPKISNNITNFMKNYGVTKTFSPGSIIIKQGAISQTVYILLSGKVDIIKSDEKGRKTLIATAEKGAIFGEMSIFLNLRRSATISAKTPVVLLEFTNKKFMEAVTNIPFLTIRVIKSLCTKLTEINSKYIKEVDANHILRIGIFILDKTFSTSYQNIFLKYDLNELSAKSGIKIFDIVKVFNKFQNENIIDKFIIDNQYISNFTIDLKKLRNYLKSFQFR